VTDSDKPDLETPAAPASQPPAHATAAAHAPGLRVQYTQTRVDEHLGQRLRRLPGVVPEDRSEPAEAVRRLRSQVLRRMRGSQHRLLAVTSLRACRAKSHTALNLALSVAAEPDASVLLIDADLGGQGLQRLLGLDAQAGLGEHLLHGTGLPSLLVNPGIARCVLLPAGQTGASGSSELLGSAAASALMQQAKARYADRWVIVDVPPLLDSADGLAFLPSVDTSLLVVEREGNTMEELETARALLAPFNLVGCVLGAPERR